MNKTFHILAAACLVCACSGGTPRRAIKNPAINYEPSIERCLESMNKTSTGHKLLKYLNGHPVQIRYAALDGTWPKLDVRENRILVPQDAKASSTTVSLLIARGIKAHEVMRETKLTEQITEVEEIAALSEARLAVEMGISEADMSLTVPGKRILDEVCAYIVEGPDKVAQKAARQASAPNFQYNRPLDSAAKMRAWLDQTKTALEEDNLPDILYKRDLDKVRKGSLSRAEADRNTARMRLMDFDELNRQQRHFYANAKDALADTLSLRRRALEDAKEWQEKNNWAFAQLLKTLPRCQSYSPVLQEIK